jgi:hypothetical protein
MRYFLTLLLIDFAQPMECQNKVIYFIPNISGPDTTQKIAIPMHIII